MLKIHHLSRKKKLFYLFLQTNLIVRTLWVHPINEDRPEKGEFYTLYPDLRWYPDKFFKMYHVSV